MWERKREAAFQVSNSLRSRAAVGPKTKGTPASTNLLHFFAPISWSGGLARAFGTQCSTTHGHSQPHRSTGLDYSLASTTLCGILVWNLVWNPGAAIHERALRSAYSLERVWS